MNEAKRRFLLGGLKVFDISQMILSFGLATILVVHWDERVSLEHFLSIRVSLSNCVTFGFILLAWNIIFSLCGLYESKRLSALRAEMLSVFEATTLSSALLALLADLFRMKMITPSFLASFWLISSFLMMGTRFVRGPRSPS